MITLDEALRFADVTYTKQSFAGILAAEVRRLREENERLRSSPWQPIATVPRDGTDVFLMRRDAVGVSAIGAGCWGRRTDGGCDEWIAFNHHQRFPQTPTHWMPIPELAP